jgi:O-antigen ligase
LIVFSAIPYGTWEPWWKAAIVSLIFFIAILAIIEWLLSASQSLQGLSIVVPILALAVFAYLQTISFRANSLSPAVDLAGWNSISADPYATRFVAIQFMALAIALALFYRYTTTPSRIQKLVYVILAIAVGSAIYGILRQTIQRHPGFVLPLTKPDQGYGQFLNKNHFAFMMEMALGLGLGMIFSGGVKRERSMIYVAALLPIWTALVLSNSRGGVLAMLAQVVIGALVLLNAHARSDGNVEESKLQHLARSYGLRTFLMATLICGLLVGTFWVGGDRLLGNFEAVRSELNPGANGLNEGATRNEIWQATLRMFAAHPILGVGIGGYWVAITAFHDASGALTPQEAHNEYLELLSSGGIVGFAIGCWFAYVLGRHLLTNLRSGDKFQRAVCFGSTLGIAGVAVHSLFDYGLHMFANAISFMALIMLATTRISPQDKVTR